VAPVAPVGPVWFHEIFVYPEAQLALELTMVMEPVELFWQA
jgi:hypothetical protein